MVYIKRDHNKKIIAIFSENEEKGLEKISNDDDELKIFLLKCALDKDYEFIKSDLELIRVIEDIIHILMEKDIIHITDFPDPVIEKLASREAIRGHFNDLSNLFDDE